MKKLFENEYQFFETVRSFQYLADTCGFCLVQKPTKSTRKTKIITLDGVKYCDRVTSIMLGDKSYCFPGRGGSAFVKNLLNGR